MQDLKLTRREMLASTAAAGATMFLSPFLRAALAAQDRSFNIGACDWSLGRTGQVSSLELAAEIGLDGVQVSFGAPGQGADLREEAVRQQYAEMEKKTGVAIASLAMGILNSVPLATHPDAEKYVAECIDVMAQMNQKVVLLAFFGAGDVRDPQKQDALIQVLKRLAPKAEKAGVILGIESQMDAQAHLRVLDGVGSDAVKVYYDVANMEGLGYPLYEEIRLLGKRNALCELHAKENGTLLGHGRVDFQQVRAALDDVGYSGWLIVESAVPPGASLPESYAHNVRYLRSVFPEGGAALRGRAAHPPFQISLAEWSLHRTLGEGKLTNLEFPAYARQGFGIDAVEYVNTFFMDKAKDQGYLRELKQRSEDAGVRNLLIMVDNEGQLGDPDEARRVQAAENHFQWVEAAKFLGCHSIRVNAHSRGNWDEQVERTADGLRRVCEFAQGLGINVLVENHGGQSSNYAWLISVIQAVGLPNCGTLPDFGNFDGYDPYRGVEALMPYAKGVSAKSARFDGNGLEANLDYHRLLQIVMASGYRGYVGIEYEGSDLSEPDGIRATQKLLELVRVGGGQREEKAPEPVIATVDFGDRKGWKVVRVDSEETAGENGRGSNVLDGDGNTFWHTEWSAKSPKHPHEIVIDLGQPRKITGFRYLPRQGGTVNGRVKDYEFFVSDDPEKLGDPVAKGTFPNEGAEQQVKFKQARQGRYIGLKALSEVNGQPWTSVAELGILSD